MKAKFERQSVFPPVTITLETEDEFNILRRAIQRLDNDGFFATPEGALIRKMVKCMDFIYRETTPQECSYTQSRDE